MQIFKPKDGCEPDLALIENLIALAKILAVIPKEISDNKNQREAQSREYAAVRTLLTNLRKYVQDSKLKGRITRIPANCKDSA
jgi:hypothetical protein